MHKVTLDQNIIAESKLKDDPFSFLGEHILRKQGYSDSEIVIFLEVLQKAVMENLQINTKNRLKLMQDSMRVCSFCESSNQLLMWSHYADSHQGFCIEYDIETWERDDVRKQLLFPVIYQTNFYDSTNHLLNYIQKSEFNNLYPIIAGSTKSKHWEYEQEWRFIIQMGNSFEPQNYKMNCQRTVFLGTRISNENRTKISKICEQRDIKVFQGKISITGHAIEFDPI